MGLFRKMRAILHDDWCSQCQSEMDVVRKQLYALPTQRVGQYREQDDPAYYKKNLVPSRCGKESPNPHGDVRLRDARIPVSPVRPPGGEADGIPACPGPGKNGTAAVL